MVLINLKHSEDDQFFYSTTFNTEIDPLRLELVRVHNWRKRLQLVILEAGDLVKYGPMKEAVIEEDLANRILYSLYIKNLSLDVSNSNSTTSTQENSKLRVGEALSEALAQPILRAIGEGAALLSKESVKARTPITLEAMQNAIEAIKKSILDAPTLLLKGDDILKPFLLDKSLSSDLDEETTTIWWANKELKPEDPLHKYIGKNERTTILVKFSKKGQGAPPRDQVQDKEAYHAMMSYYHRKQEEHNKLMENNEDSFTSSSWADSKVLRSNFAGLSNISYKPS